MPLNAEQEIIANFRSGTAVVAAGAGSGKTTTLIERARRLIEQGENPSRVLILVFNASAGADLKRRLDAKDIGGLAAGTFHAWGKSRMGEINDAVGKPRPALVGGEAWAVISESIRLAAFTSISHEDWHGRKGQGGRKGVSKSIPLNPWKKITEEAREALCWLLPDGSSKSADVAIIPTLPSWENLELDIGRGPVPITPEMVWGVARAYQDQKQATNKIDFADMLWQPCRHIQKKSPYAIGWQSKYSHVMLDELQDSSPARFLIGDWLSLGARSYLGVGDLRQSIYSFTGARPELYVMPLPIASDTNPIGGQGYRELVPGVRVSAQLLTLRTNYRSGNRIVNLANRIAEGQPWNLGGAAIAGRDTMGQAEGKVCGAGDQAARAILDEVQDGGVEDKEGRSRCAVLARTRALLLPVRIMAKLRGIPVRTLSTEGSIWDSALATDVIAYLKISEGDYSELTSVAWKPRRYFKGREALFPAIAEAEATGTDLVESLLSNRDRALREFGEDLAGLQGATWPQRCDRIAEWLTRNVEERAAEGDKKLSAEDISAADTIEALCQGAGMLGSLTDIQEAAIEERAEIEADRKGEQQPPALELLTAHKCVHPDTLVETPDGLHRIADIHDTGVIATPLGFMRYINKVVNPEGPALKITTKSGYSIIVTPTHGMTVTCGAGVDLKLDVRLEARELKVGDVLRLRLGTQAEQELPFVLAPPAPVADVRAAKYTLPEVLTHDMAELLGMIIADGTVYSSGFRYSKADQDVRDRFSELCSSLFGVRVSEWHKDGTEGGSYYSEVSSTFLADWLLSWGGVTPSQKGIPAAVLRSSLAVQRAFLRGLFEDGTVNVRDGHVDHVHFDNIQHGLVQTVQTMLLRFGIVSAIRRHSTGRDHEITTLYIYSQFAKRFRDMIGFIAERKQAKLETGTFGDQTGYTVPISRNELDVLKTSTTRWDRQNGRWRGYLSRATVEALAERSGNRGDFLRDRLKWHYEPIRSIEAITAPSMCVEVPSCSRFFQNGFDGWNSKGLEWERVWIIGADKKVMPSPRSDNEPEEHRLFYVACTRAKDHLTVCHSGVPSKYVTAYLESPEVEAEERVTEARQGEPPSAREDDSAESPPELLGIGAEWARAADQAVAEDDADMGKSVNIRRRVNALWKLLKPLGFGPGRGGLWGSINGNTVAVLIDQNDGSIVVEVGLAEERFTGADGWRSWVVDHLANLAAKAA